VTVPAKVWLSVRTPPNIMPRTGPAGLPNDVMSIPLFHLPSRLSDRTAAELSPEEKDAVSHRGRALALLVPALSALAG